MRIETNKHITVFVASDQGKDCPVLKAAEHNTRIRDDYAGRVSFNKKLAMKLFQ